MKQTFSIKKLFVVSKHWMNPLKLEEPIFSANIAVLFTVCQAWNKIAGGWPFVVSHSEEWNWLRAPLKILNLTCLLTLHSSQNFDNAALYLFSVYHETIIMKWHCLHLENFAVNTVACEWNTYLNIGRKCNLVQSCCHAIVRFTYYLFICLSVFCIVSF